MVINFNLTVANLSFVKLLKVLYRNTPHKMNHTQIGNNMLGKFFRKKKEEAQQAISKIENKDLMEAIVAASVLVANANKTFSNEGMLKLQGIIEVNPSLKHLQSEIGATVDRYCEMYEASSRLARSKLMKEIEDLKADPEQKEEAFIIAIEIADADGNIDEAEMKVLNEIGKLLGLNAEKYING